MPSIKDLLAKVKTLPSAAANFFRKLAENFPRVNMRGKFRSLVDKLLKGAGKLRNSGNKPRGLSGKLAQFAREKLPGTKERLIFAGFVCAAFFLMFSVVFLLVNRSGDPERTEMELTNSAQTVIPPEDIFLPDEPDFVPGILLERERRTAWTAEDAEPFWLDPLKNGEEPSRRQLESEIDELMERVP